MSETMSKTSTDSAIQGYFVAMGEEAVTFKKDMVVNTGRSGVHYRKEDLISTLGSKTALKGRDMEIVEISVPKTAVINPNGIKFGIKYGQGIPIQTIQSFKVA